MLADGDPSQFSIFSCPNLFLANIDPNNSWLPSPTWAGVLIMAGGNFPHAGRAPGSVRASRKKENIR